MPFDLAIDDTQELDPYSVRVVYAVDCVGPAVAQVRVSDQDGRARGSGVVYTPDGYLGRLDVPRREPTPAKSGKRAHVGSPGGI